MFDITKKDIERAIPVLLPSTLWSYVHTVMRIRCNNPQLTEIRIDADDSMLLHFAGWLPYSFQRAWIPRHARPILKARQTSAWYLLWGV